MGERDKTEMRVRRYLDEAGWLVRGDDFAHPDEPQAWMPIRKALAIQSMLDAGSLRTNEPEWKNK